MLVTHKPVRHIWFYLSMACFKYLVFAIVDDPSATHAHANYRCSKQIGRFFGIWDFYRIVLKSHHFKTDHRSTPKQHNWKTKFLPASNTGSVERLRIVCISFGFL